MRAPAANEDKTKEPRQHREGIGRRSMRALLEHARVRPMWNAAGRTDNGCYGPPFLLLKPAIVRVLRFDRVDLLHALSNTH
jgi:hypothetical protein